MIKLIAGLGNPEERYAKTRHNAGFWLLDMLTNDWRLEKKFMGLYNKRLIANHPIHLLKPQTYMNNSGQALAAICRFYDITPDQVLIIHDELDLPEGSIKLKYSGGHGGHNGLRDIIKALNSKDFYRLRIGIDHPGNRNDVVDYVLKAPSKSSLLLIEESLKRGVDILPTLIQDGAEKTMNTLHRC